MFLFAGGFIVLFYFYKHEKKTKQKRKSLHLRVIFCISNKTNLPRDVQVSTNGFL